MTHVRLSTAIWFAAIVASGISAASAVELRVDRVEPPTWWASDDPQQIMFLVEGAGLEDVHVSASGDAIKIGKVEPGRDGQFLFVEATIAADAAPGKIDLRFEGPSGADRHAWRLVEAPSHKPQPLTPDDVIYLIMPDRFANGDPSNDRQADEDDMVDRSDVQAYHGGDFKGIREKLPYLADLGVTAIWLNPVYRQNKKPLTGLPPSPAIRFSPYHGYMPIDFFDTNPRFGSFEEYRALVDEAHRLGLKVIQDQIVGYTGLQHRWLKSLPTEDWYHGPIDRPPIQTFDLAVLARSDAKQSQYDGVLKGWFLGILPDLATENPRVRTYAIQQSLWWIVMGGADGVRLDTYPMVERSFWRDWDERTRKLHPDFFTVGEAWVTDPKLLSFYQGGRQGWDGIDPGVATVFDFPLYQSMVAVFTGKAPASLLAQTIDADRVCPNPDILVTFFDNHDTQRLTQVGASPRMARVATTFLLTTRGIPQLTWGDEIGFTADVDHRAGIPGAFDSDPRDAFTAEGRTEEEQATFEHWRSLLHLRKSTPAMRRGRLTDLVANDSIYAYMREYEGARAVTVLNISGSDDVLSLPISKLGELAAVEAIHGDGVATLKPAEGKLELKAPPESATIFLLKR